MTTTKTITYGYKSHVGRVRDTNEDSCAVLNRSQLNSRLDCLLIVADGLGGRKAGEVASSLLVETVSFGALETTSSQTRPFNQQDVEELLHDTIIRANGKIMTHGRYNSRVETRGMATTCVAAIVSDGRLTIGNVGDSRIYLQRGDLLRQLTEDHSEVFQELIKGNITEEEARNHRFRNQITRAVGLGPDVVPDIDSIGLSDGDTVLLCSDGLTTEMPDSAIAEVLCTAPDAQAACDRLVALALNHGGRDNVTVVVMRYGEFTPLGPFRELLETPEETDTDPEQNWRKPAQARDMDEQTWRDDAPEPGSNKRDKANFEPVLAAPPRYRPGTPAAYLAGAAPAIIGILILANLVQAAMMYNLQKQLAAKPPVIAETPNPMVKTPVAMVYEPIVQVLDTTVLPDYLQISPKGNPIVAKPDGTLVTVLMADKKLLPMGPLYPTMPPAAKKPAKVKRTTGDLVCDSAGTVYYLNPQTSCIETYIASGTRTNQDLGKGALKAPTRINVDPHGNIYVIDDGHLKVINVKGPEKVSNHPSNADF